MARHRGGLAGFDQPRYLHVEATDGPARRPRAHGRGAAGAGVPRRERVMAVVLIATAPMLQRSRRGHGSVLLAGRAASGCPGSVCSTSLTRRGVRHLETISLALGPPLVRRRGGGARRPRRGGGRVPARRRLPRLRRGPERRVAHRRPHARGHGRRAVAQRWRARRPPAGRRALAGTLLVWMLADAAHRQDTSRAGLVQVSGKADAILASIASRGDRHVPDRAGPASGTRPPPAPSAARRSTSAGARCAEVLGLHLGIRQLRCDEGCALLELSATDGRLRALAPRPPRAPTAAAGQRRRRCSTRTAWPVEIVHSLPRHHLDPGRRRGEDAVPRHRVARAEDARSPSSAASRRCCSSTAIARGQAARTRSAPSRPAPSSWPASSTGC